MTTYKRWPIGLQSSPTGKPTGIDKVIRALTDAGIAMFSASSDSMSILFDLQKEHKETGVPHTGNFIPTGYVDGYHLSVPEYRKPHSRQLAVRHWDAVEKRGIPPEIDWDLPCIWLSTWNEIRPYVGWGSMAKIEDWEQPFGDYEGYADLIGWQAVEIGKEALKRGYRWAAFGFAGGNPEPGFWDAPGMLEYLRLCDEHPEQLGLALHEYSFHESIINRPDHIGRFQQVHAVCDKHGLRRPVIQIKEFGWEERWVPEPEHAIPELVEVAKLYMQHPNIHGAAIWTVAGGWSGLASKVGKLIPHLTKAGLENAQPIKELKVKEAVKTVDAAEADGFDSDISMDNVPVGTSFKVSWTFKNSGESTWDGRYQLAYSDIAHPETNAVSRTAMGAAQASSITEIGAPAKVKPGQRVTLTVKFKAPNKPGTYGSNWQLQAPDGSRFGSIRWMRPVVTGDAIPEEEMHHAYQWLTFKNSEVDYNNMPPCLRFSGTWTIKNTGSHAWSGDYQVAYVDRSTEGSQDAVRDRMGAKTVYTLKELTGSDQVLPGQTIEVPFNLISPQQKGLYAFHWEMRTNDGQPFGTTRWLRIGVRGVGVTPIIKDPIPTDGRTQFGMNINPHHPNYVEDVDRMRGLGWVRFVFWASREGNSPAEAFHKRYRHVIQSYADAGIKSLIIVHQDTEWGGNLRDNGDWEGYARVFAKACAGVARACADFSDMVAYQIYNETDSGYSADTGNFNKSAIGIAPEDYAIVLDHAQKAIREVDPNATIVMGGMKTGPNNAVGYIKAVQKQLNGRLPVDALAMHPYGRYVHFAPFNYGQIGPLSDSLSAFKNAFPDKPLWITEIGTPGGDNALDPKHYPTIARYMSEVVNDIAKNHAKQVPVLIWFAWSDQLEHAGMIDHSGQMKSHIGDAYQEMITLGLPPAPKSLSLEELEALVEAEFLSFSTSLANYNAVPAESTFTNRWTYKNTGGQTWGDGYKLVYAPANDDSHPDPMSEETSFDLADVASPMPAEPGEEVVITLNLKAPALFGRSYVSRWELRDPGGETFAYCYSEITVVPPLTAGTNVRTSAMAFVADKTVPDGTRYVAGSDFDKQWLVRNTGTRQWGTGFRLNYVQGDSNMARGIVSHIVPEAKPGEEVILSIPMTAPPVSNGQATAYNSLWRMQDDRGNVFGDPIWARIVSTPVIDVTTGEGTALSRLLNDRSMWYSQRNPSWERDKLGHGHATIGSWGCLMTCMAMALTAYGHRLTPPELNEKLKTLGNNGFRGSSVQFVGPAYVGQLRYKGNVTSWPENADDNAVWTGEHPIDRIDNALAAGHMVLTQVDSKPNNGLFDSNIEQHWVIIVKRTPAGDDYLIIDPLTPPSQVDQQPFSLMSKYGISVPSQSNEVNLRNSIRSTLVYYKPGGSGG